MDKLAVMEAAFLDELEKIAGIGGELLAGWRAAGVGLRRAAGSGQALSTVNRFRALKPMHQALKAVGGTTATSIGAGARMLAKPAAIAGGVGLGLYGAKKMMGQPQQQQQRY